MNAASVPADAGADATGTAAPPGADDEHRILSFLGPPNKLVGLIILGIIILAALFAAARFSMYHREGYWGATPQESREFELCYLNGVNPLRYSAAVAGVGLANTAIPWLARY